MSDFARQVLLERARLACLDPAGELEAAAPLSPVRARPILLELAEEDDRRRIPVARFARLEQGELETGRELLDRLGADPDRWHGVIRCPSHEDRSASLSWRLADDGKALLHCFAGYTFEEILEPAA